MGLFNPSYSSSGTGSSSSSGSTATRAATQAPSSMVMLASHLHGWLASPMELLALELPSLSNRAQHTSSLGHPFYSSSSSSSSPVESGTAAGAETAEGGAGEGGAGGARRLGGRGWVEGLERPTASKTSHQSQCTFILPYCDAKGRPYFIYVGDR